MLESACRETLRISKQILAEGDPLEAEAWASHLVAVWDSMPLIDEDPVSVFGGALVRHARKRATPAALLTLRALGAVAPKPVGASARKAARELGGRVTVPAWTNAIGKARFAEGWIASDRYGDQDAVMAGFEHAGFAPHTLTVLIDHNLGDIVKDAFLTPAAAEEMAGLWQDRGPGDMVVRPIDAGEVAAAIRSGLETADAFVDAPASETLDDCRALLRARIGRLRATPTPPPRRRSDDGPAAVIDAFMASPQAQGLERAETIADIIVQYRYDECDDDPLRWSPTVVELFLLDWLPRKATIEVETTAAVPDVLRAWVRHAGGQRQLPDHLVAETLAYVDELEPDYLDAMADPSRYGPAKTVAMQMLADGVDPEDGEAVRRWVDDFNEAATRNLSLTR